MCPGPPVCSFFPRPKLRDSPASLPSSLRGAHLCPLPTCALARAPRCHLNSPHLPQSHCICPLGPGSRVRRGCALIPGHSSFHAAASSGDFHFLLSHIRTQLCSTNLAPSSGRPCTHWSSPLWALVRGAPPDAPGSPGGPRPRPRRGSRVCLQCLRVVLVIGSAKRWLHLVPQKTETLTSA